MAFSLDPILVPVVFNGLVEIRTCEPRVIDPRTSNLSIPIQYWIKRQCRDSLRESMDNYRRKRVFVPRHSDHGG